MAIIELQENNRVVKFFAPCARCGNEHQLIQRGRLWLQPKHDCDGTLSETFKQAD